MATLKGIGDWYKRGQRQTSDAILRLGRGRAVWIRGVLFFGGTMFLVTTVCDFFFRPHELHGRWEAGWLALSLLLWGLIGYAFGLFQWRRAMRRRGKLGL